VHSRRFTHARAPGAHCTVRRCTQLTQNNTNGHAAGINQAKRTVPPTPFAFSIRSHAYSCAQRLGLQRLRQASPARGREARPIRRGAYVACAAPACLACACTSPFRARLWSMSHGENIGYQWYSRARHAGLCRHPRPCRGAFDCCADHATHHDATPSRVDATRVSCRAPLS
jgi:hypothetical protein